GEPGDLRLLLVGGRSCVDHRTWTPGRPQQGSGSSCPPGVLRPTHASVHTHPSSLCNLLHKLVSGSLEVDPEDTARGETHDRPPPPAGTTRPGLHHTDQPRDHGFHARRPGRGTQRLRTDGRVLRRTCPRW